MNVILMSLEVENIVHKYTLCHIEGLTLLVISEPHLSTIISYSIREDVEYFKKIVELIGDQLLSSNKKNYWFQLQARLPNISTLLYQMC